MRRLGEGAFGVVEEAIDQERGLRVARKSLKRLGTEARMRFKSEFRALADLTHPNLPLFFELFTEGDDWFFTMEVVDGTPLDAWVRGPDVSSPGSVARSRTRSLVTHMSSVQDARDASSAEVGARTLAPIVDGAEPRLRSAIEQLRRVLSFLHARGYVHRDLKPSNVRVRADGRLVLLDFGLATRIGDVEERFVGTTAYAAPEQARREPVTAAVDAYALGAIVHELIVGRPPFPGSGMQVLLDKQVRPPPDIRSVVPTVPEDLAALVDGWLEPDPSARAPVADVGSARGEIFVGRGRELGLLREAFGAVAEGDTRVVLVEGESGIGKSTLVEQALDAMRERCPEMTLFVGRPSPKERVPFNAFDGALARAGHATTKEGAGTQRTKVHRAVRAMLEMHATAAPLVVWIDDLQWADDDSLALLLSLLRPPQLRPALFVLSRRPVDEAAARDPAFVFPCARQVISLAPLAPAESTLLARHFGLSSARSSSVATRSGGHPLFVKELCQWSSDARIELDEVLLRRVGAAPELERQLLRLLAMSQTPLGEARLARGVKASRGDVARALERLRRAQLVRVDPRGGVGYRTYHDRIREVVAGMLTREERLRVHEAILDALADDGAQEGDLHARLEHLFGAERAEEAAGVALRASARAAEVGAYRQAAVLLEEALRTGCVPPEEERTVRAKRIELLERAHCVVEAADEAMVVAELASDDPAEADGYRMRAARHYLATGDLVRGRAVLAGLLERADVHMPASGFETLVAMLVARRRVRRALRRGGAQRSSEREARAYALLRSVADGLGMTDHVRGHLFQTRALASALASESLETRAEALVVEALYVGSTTAKGRRTAERYIEAARSLFPDRTLPARARAWEQVARATFAKHERPSYAVVAALADAERGVAELGGDAWWLGSIRLVRGHCLRILGDLPELRRHAASLVEDAEARRDFFVLTTAHLGSVLVWLADDAPLAARQIVSQVKWPDEPATFLVQHWLGTEAEVEMSLYEGRGDTLLERLGPARSFLRFSLVKRLQSVRVCCHYTLGRALVAAIAAGRASAAEHLEIRAVLWALRREGLGYAAARAAILEAGLRAATGERERAIEALEVVEREGRRAELILEPIAAAYLRASLSPTEGHVAAHLHAVDALRKLGVRSPSAFVRVIAPGFASRDYETISTAPSANL
ncbi:MAG: AAA family ATPase [Labilithrix sp.]|nr:AAA family ATPase [Labilithrix sp.]